MADAPWSGIKEDTGRRIGHSERSCKVRVALWLSLGLHQSAVGPRCRCQWFPCCICWLSHVGGLQLCSWDLQLWAGSGAVLLPQKATVGWIRQCGLPGGGEHPGLLWPNLAWSVASSVCRWKLQPAGSCLPLLPLLMWHPSCAGHAHRCTAGSSGYSEAATNAPDDLLLAHVQLVLRSEDSVRPAARPVLPTQHRAPLTLRVPILAQPVSPPCAPPSFLVSFLYFCVNL